MHPGGMPDRAPQNNAVIRAAHRWSVRFSVLSESRTSPKTKHAEAYTPTALASSPGGEISRRLRPPVVFTALNHRIIAAKSLHLARISATDSYLLLFTAHLSDDCDSSLSPADKSPYTSGQGRTHHLSSLSWRTSVRQTKTSSFPSNVSTSTNLTF